MSWFGIVKWAFMLQEDDSKKRKVPEIEAGGKTKKRKWLHENELDLNAQAYVDRCSNKEWSQILLVLFISHKTI